MRQFVEVWRGRPRLSALLREMGVRQGQSCTRSGASPHTYEKPGKYRILVRVIDIFGNDTSQAFDVAVK
jgi:hypothetical protein